MTRVIVAIVLGAAVLAAIAYLPASEFRWLVLAVIALGFVEITRMRFTDPVERWSVAVAGFVVASGMIVRVSAPALALLLSAAVFACALVVMRRTRSMEGSADRLGFAAFALIYLGIAMPMWSWVRELDGGQWWVLMGLVPACLSDTFAFLAGKAFGRRKFAPIVSPNKTIEGFMGALAGSLIGAFGVWVAAGRPYPRYHAVIIAFLIWWVAPMGDLIESMIKRSVGVKDSGTIIKGHGGVLDRLDALIFAGPFIYAYAKYVVG